MTMTMSSVHACHVDRESLPSTCLRPDGKKSQSLRTSCEAVSGHRGGLFFNIFRNDQQTVFTNSFSSSAHFARFCATALHVPRFLPGLLKNCSIASPHLLVGLQGILNPCLGPQANVPRRKFLREVPKRKLPNEMPQTKDQRTIPSEISPAKGPKRKIPRTSS